MPSVAIILLTNDDGHIAPGLAAIADALTADGHVVRVAVPDRERSGAGHAVTLHEPLRASRFDFRGLEAFRLSGTPVDCVKLSTLELWKEQPEIVVSGINLGANVGENVFYSGTVSAAAEAAMNGFPAAALSLDIGKPEFGYASEIGLRIVNAALAHGLPEGVFLNINVPNRPQSEIRGLRFTRQGRSGYHEYYMPTSKDRPEAREFRVDGDMIIREEPIEFDAAALRDGWVSVTPLGLCLDAEKSRGAMAALIQTAKG
jgi:5'-nucleotidase